jgi:hypothetical protein
MKVVDPCFRWTDSTHPGNIVKFESSQENLVQEDVLQTTNTDNKEPSDEVKDVEAIHTPATSLNSSRNEETYLTAPSLSSDVSFLISIKSVASLFMMISVSTGYFVDEMPLGGVYYQSI